MAANKFKGLTIEIGGDTTPLQKSLEGVNKKTKDIQNELYQVDRLLKLDPKNTELMAQKQKLLNEAISGTKDKLELVKEAEKQVKEQFDRGEASEEQYRAIQREVIGTEQELRRLEDTLNDVNGSWNKAADNIGKFGNGAENAGKKLLPVTAAITAGGIAVAKMSMDFDESMAKVSTIADETQMPLKDMKEAILDLSNQTGISATEIANNVYDAISAGQETGDAVNFVSNSLKLSKAGYAEAGDALNILTTILNAYNLEADEATRVNDILIQTQNKGKVTVAELSSTMGKIIPTAKMANVNLEQLGAGYAIMTSKGIAAAETTTYMNSMLNELSKTGSKSDKALKDLTGKSFAELSKEGKSIADVLEILSQNAEKSGLKLSDMFGSGEAAKAALILLGDGAEEFNATLSEMGNASGNTEAALKDLETPAQSLKESFNKLSNAGIKMGEALSPVINKIVKLMESISDTLVNMDDGTLNTIIVIAGFVAALGPLLIITGKIATGISALMTLVSSISGLFAASGASAGVAAGGTGAFSGALAVITGPIGIAIAAIVALIAIVVHLWKTNEEFRGKVGEIWDGIKEIFSLAVELIGDIVEAFVDWFKELWDKYGESITKITDGLWQGILGIIQGVIEIIKGIIQVFIGLFTGDFEKMKTGITNIWKGLWTAIKSVVSGAWSMLSGAFGILKDSISGWFTGLASSAVNWGKNMISGFIDGIKSMAASAASAVQSVIGGVKSYIGFNSPAEKGEGRNIVKWGANMIGGFKDGIESAIPALENTMSKVISKPSLSVAGASSDASTVNYVHTGSIKIIGVNNSGETIAVIDQVMNQIRKETRRR